MSHLTHTQKIRNRRTGRVSQRVIRPFFVIINGKLVPVVDCSAWAKQPCMKEAD
jgi:hypothetical protein